MLALLVIGCAEDQFVALEGIVVTSRTSTAGLGGATTTFLDEHGRLLDTATTDSLGAFSIELPAGVNVFVRIDAEGHVSTVFPGVIGSNPTQTVEGYALYGMPLEDHAALLAMWEGCPGLADDAFVAVGELKVFGLTDDTSNAPSVNTGTAALDPITTSGAAIAGCYLTNDGTAYDAGAERTGDSGQWLVAGAGPGAWSLDVGYEYGLDTWETETYPVWSPGDGPVVSPWYPAWVEFAD